MFQKIIPKMRQTTKFTSRKRKQNSRWTNPLYSSKLHSFYLSFFSLFFNPAQRKMWQVEQLKCKYGASTAELLPAERVGDRILLATKIGDKGNAWNFVDSIFKLFQSVLKGCATFKCSKNEQKCSHFDLLYHCNFIK